ncbi:MAG: hypothetical protein ACI9LX_003436 [Paraglaciecola sp.]|jgi:hypothetical protein
MFPIANAENFSFCVSTYKNKKTNTSVFVTSSNHPAYTKKMTQSDPFATNEAILIQKAITTAKICVACAVVCLLEAKYIKPIRINKVPVM